MLKVKGAQFPEDIQWGVGVLEIHKIELLTDFTMVELLLRDPRKSRGSVSFVQ